MPQAGSSILPDTVVATLNKYQQQQSPSSSGQGSTVPPTSPTTDRHYHHHHHSHSQSYGHQRGHSHSSSFSSSTAPFLPSSSSTSALASSTGINGNSTTPTATSNSNATRILQLQHFSTDLKTKDIQLIFNEWEDDKGGFKIKWNDDTSCWIVFNDATTAKRAYLKLLTDPPEQLVPTNDCTPKLTAYAGPETQSILQAVSMRTRSRSMGSGHSRRGSALGSGGGSALAGVMAQQQQQQVPPLPTGSGEQQRMGHGRNLSFGRERRQGSTGGSFGQKQWSELMDSASCEDSSGTPGGRSGNRSRPSSPEQGRRSPELSRGGSWRAAENRSGSDTVASAVSGLTIHE
ncbi:hypothetical protein OIO90_004333 [Microbotryomycetes sp. JL221]|nr:hypothetical protein OIO90_004333 [Microbotryomycetes sp. JL221]